MFVLVSRYTPPNEKRVIVHAYGPYDTRAIAEKEKRTEQRQYPDVEFHVCKVLDESIFGDL